MKTEQNSSMQHIGMKVVIKANIFPGIVPRGNDKNMLLIVNTIFVSHRTI